jgi:hypothetical protein
VLLTRRPQEETPYLVAAVESRASLRLVNLLPVIIQIFDKKEFESKISYVISYIFQ